MGLGLGVGEFFGVGDGFGVGEGLGVGDGLGVGVGLGGFSGDWVSLLSSRPLVSSALTLGTVFNAVKAMPFNTARKIAFRRKRDVTKNLDFMK